MTHPKIQRALDALAEAVKFDSDGLREALEKASETQIGEKTIDVMMASLPPGLKRHMAKQMLQQRALGVADASIKASNIALRYEAKGDHEEAALFRKFAENLAKSAASMNPDNEEKPKPTETPAKPDRSAN